MEPKSDQIEPFLGGYAIASCLWVRPILIRPRLAIEQHKDEQNNPTYYRNQTDEYPPSGATGIVEPADRHSEARNQDRQRIDAFEQTNARLRAEGPDQVVDSNQHHRDDEVDEEEHPVFFSPRPPVEHRVLFNTSRYQLTMTPLLLTLLIQLEA